MADEEVKPKSYCAALAANSASLDLQSDRETAHAGIISGLSICVFLFKSWCDFKYLCIIVSVGRGHF